MTYNQPHTKIILSLILFTCLLTGVGYWHTVKAKESNHADFRGQSELSKQVAEMNQLALNNHTGSDSQADSNTPNQTNLHIASNTKLEDHLPKDNPNKFSLVPYAATYQGFYNGKLVSSLAKRELRQLSNQRYQLRHDFEYSVVEFKEKSTFLMHDNISKPLNYKWERKALWIGDREKDSKYDWQNMKIEYNYKGKSKSIRLQPKVQDPLTAHIALAQAILSKPSDEQFIKYTEFDDKRLKEKVFKYHGEESIQIENKSYQTYVISRHYSTPKKRSTKVWLLKEKPYIPVKMEQDDEGDHILLLLKDLNFK